MTIRSLRFVSLLALVLVFLVAACAPAPSATPAPVTTAEATAEATAETTVEATAEATAEVTADATVEATAEATVEATAEVTVEATAEATAEATVEATAEATVEATAEATVEATAEATVEATPVVEVTADATLVAEATAEATLDPNLTIVDIASENKDFSTLVAAIVAADLSETLSGEGPFTVFAPTNAAFAEALRALELTPNQLLTNRELLTSVLTYHVVEGRVLAEDVVALDGETVETVNGERISIAVVDGEVVLNGTVTVTTTDILAGNGVIHVIDGVLLPPSLGN